ncbi:DUF4249 domain-containing protein [Rufibacter sediminis]|uniref:DUF4249 domain-containing protein n=1 Tax=Rufibacter sediminis TaxID=2762756 RepID=A0ABR6VLW9_9BACT|nr:DUF4249 domain-containing protein [Rufibacter sediminis]MBC3538203.1 DUF4249 domain-containing protein [Rufibacter sediminis]
MRFPKNSLKTALSWLCLLFLASCEEPYAPEVVEGPNSFLVVSGFINSNGPTTIKLSRTQNLSDESAPKVQSGATVALEEENGNTFPLRETEAGTYFASALPIIGDKKYRLVISASGDRYASDYLEVKYTPTIDDITWKTDDGNLQVSVSSHDDQNNTRYYRWEFEETWEYSAYYYSVLEYVNGQMRDRDPRNQINLCWRFNNSSSIQIGNTVRLSQDVMSNFPLLSIPSNSEKLNRKYSILVKQYALTKEAYDYWEALKKNTESIGTLFDPLPTQLTGNIRSLTTPSEPVIGFMAISSVQEKRIFISRSDLPTGWGIRSQFCPFDTVKVGEEGEYFSGSGYLPVDRIYSNSMALIGYAGASSSCVDCRVFGTTQRPAYWQ